MLFTAWFLVELDRCRYFKVSRYRYRYRYFSRPLLLDILLIWKTWSQFPVSARSPSSPVSNACYVRLLAYGYSMV